MFCTGALAISMIGILAIGIFPTPLFNMAGHAARAVRGALITFPMTRASDREIPS